LRRRASTRPAGAAAAVVPATYDDPPRFAILRLFYAPKATWTLLTREAPDYFSNAAKLIPWNDVRGEEDFRAKNVLLSLENADHGLPPP
jgi:hypothetical protein